MRISALYVGMCYSGTSKQRAFWEHSVCPLFISSWEAFTISHGGTIVRHTVCFLSEIVV